MTANDKKENSSYRSILKGTSLFGGAQIFQILINMIRGKFVAAILGPAGWGVSALFNTSSATILKMASLGLNLAVTKEVADKKSDPHVLQTTVNVARRLILATAIIGALVCIGFSRLLSLATFSDASYTWSFMLLGVFIFFSILGNGDMSVLQGLRKSKRLVTASLIGSLTGLFVGVPLYYMMGTDGIVPAMCVLAVVTWAFYMLSVRKSIGRDRFEFSRDLHMPIVRNLIAIGMVLMAADLIGSLTTYLAQMFIRRHAGLNEVGLYTAALNITAYYSGVVFSAMALDYLPRLSAAAHDNAEMNIIVNRQTEIVTLLIGPVVTLFILCAPLAIRILLRADFMASLPLMRWMALGVAIKALMYPMGYISFARDNRKLFFWLEGVGCNLLTLILSCAGFYFFDLIGLGYAMVADNLICLAAYYVINRRVFGYRFSAKALRGMIKVTAVTSAALAVSLCGDGAAVYSVLAIIAAAVTLTDLHSLRNILRKDRDDQSEK